MVGARSGGSRGGAPCAADMHVDHNASKNGDASVENVVATSAALCVCVAVEQGKVVEG